MIVARSAKLRWSCCILLALITTSVTALCDSVVGEFRVKTHHSDTERAEIAQRNHSTNTFCEKPPPELKTASTHPIQYYLSLPEGWTAEKKWPVVVVIESAERDFSQAATAFEKARGHKPFILVTPLVVTNGGAGFRQVPTYHYADPVWERIQSSGQFTFDMEGITAIVADVLKQYGGEGKYFVTGFEAGGHTVWGILFNHPEAVRGAALVCPNYLGRWVDETHIASATNHRALPIRNFVGTKDELCQPGHPIFTQMQRAMTLADANGYKSISLVRVEGKGHERLADEVLAYFSSLL